ncbi:uncharacterized protein MONOS_16913 [Monocercomonoides exilis]|uniref:uncharacterized protein n=1 Tax=Monocercomonoides exilis TaxID=2049356 RepID=UPI00355A3FA7|nr:hypothetical protein MONOS_16913 [Monocercomonoides exilis]
MIEEEEKKEDEKDETLLVDLCECYLSLHHYSGETGEILSIIVPCLLNIALNKEESEEAQIEVEMALVSLSNISWNAKVKEELYLNEIKDIIQHHQKRHNLTRFAYQSAWKFLINRFSNNKGLGDIIVIDLHFAREATRELEEMERHMDWNKKNKVETEMKEMWMIKNWHDTLRICIQCNNLSCKGNTDLFACLAKLCKSAAYIDWDMFQTYLNILSSLFYPTIENAEYLVRGGALDAVLNEMCRFSFVFDLATLYAHLPYSLFRVFEEKVDKNYSMILKKIKREAFEKLEEEGYEDIVFSFTIQIIGRLFSYRPIDISIYLLIF